MRKKTVKRALAWLLCLLGLAAGRTSAAGEGITLRTVSCFGGTDPAADAYVQILKQYEAETNNRVQDYSTPSDEAWKASVLNDFAAGNEPDILFFFAAGADSAPILSRVVPVSEINEAYPEMKLPETEALREADGLVYAVPCRGFWEGLYLRTDLFEAAGAPIPEDWDSLREAVRKLRAAGIVPLAASLSDIPHYVAEMAILACATAEEQQRRPRSLEEVPESWVRAMEVIRELQEMGAFPETTEAMDDRAATELFIQGGAAMRLDGSWLADAIPEELMDRLAVKAMPRRDGQGSAEAYIGGTSMGFYLTRKAWKQEERRAAAVALLRALTLPESLAMLENRQMSGQLEASALALGQGRKMLPPLQDAMNREARETWLLECIPAVAEGKMTAEECWRRVMALHPFDQ